MKDRAEPYCQCFVDEAQAVIPYKEFVRLTLRMAVDDKVPPEFQPMMNTCAQRVLGVPPGEERVETQQ
jgi:hypothetical protein